MLFADWDISAHLNPLAEKPKLADDMTPEYHGLSEGGLDEMFKPANFGEEAMSLKDIEDKLLELIGSIGADFRDINSIEIVEWLAKMESCENRPQHSKELRKYILEKLTKAEGFEKFLQKGIWDKKIFPRGLESLIPMMHVLSNEAANHGGEEVCVGMAHKEGLMCSPTTWENHMITCFASLKELNSILSTSMEMLYHYGFANESETFSGKSVRIYLAANPRIWRRLTLLSKVSCEADKNKLETKNV